MIIGSKTARISAALCLGFLLICAAGNSPAGTRAVYLKATLGSEGSLTADFSDRDCTSQNPPALFGCGVGADGRDLGASGGFDRRELLEAGLGYRVLPGIRLEAVAGYRPDTDYDGTANFLGVSGTQPVTARMNQQVAMVFGFVDIPPLIRKDVTAWKGLTPFIGAGIGITRTRISDMTYRFPALDNGPTPAFSRVPGDTRHDLVWAVTAGLALPVTQAMTLELAYRYTDYGTLETNPGDMQVVRPLTGKDFPLRIDRTEADLRSHGILLSLRFDL